MTTPRKPSAKKRSKAAAPAAKSPKAPPQSKPGTPRGDQRLSSPEEPTDTSSGRRKRQPAAPKAGKDPAGQKDKPKAGASTPSPTAIVDDLGLTERQKRFVFEFHLSGNATDAARRAGYAVKTASAEGVRLQANVKVAEAIRRLDAKRYERLGQDAERTRLEIARLANSKITNVCAWKRNRLTLFDSDQISEDDLATIQEVSYDAKGRLRVKMHDKKGALDMQARANGIYEDETPPPPPSSTTVNVHVGPREINVKDLGEEERRACAAAILARRARAAQPEGGGGAADPPGGPGG